MSNGVIRAVVAILEGPAAIELRVEHALEVLRGLLDGPEGGLVGSSEERAREAARLRQRRSRANKKAVSVTPESVTSGVTSTVTEGVTVTPRISGSPSSLCLSLVDTSTKEEKTGEEIQDRERDASRVTVSRDKRDRDSHGHQRVMAAYFECFEKARGKKPVITSKDGKAVQKLIDAMGAEEAEATVRDSFANDWFARNVASLWQLAQDPNKYRGRPKDAPSGVQRTGKNWVQPVPEGGSIWKVGQ